MVLSGGKITFRFRSTSCQSGSLLLISAESRLLRGTKHPQPSHFSLLSNYSTQNSQRGRTLTPGWRGNLEIMFSQSYLHDLDTEQRKEYVVSQGILHVQEQGKLLLWTELRDRNFLVTNNLPVHKDVPWNTHCQLMMLSFRNCSYWHEI